MTGKRKKSGFSGGRTVTVAFSLCLLAVVTMIGMYTVGKTDEQQQELERRVAEAQKKAEELAAAEEETAAEQETQEAVSASAARDREEEKEEETETAQVDGAELESEFAQAKTPESSQATAEELQQTSSDGVAREPELSFSAGTDQLLWPVAGNIILDYSMDKTVYFATLDQYKYNPAVIIQGSLDESVMSAAQGKITAIETREETGLTVTMDIGGGYEVVYGQLKELPVKEGDYVKAGDTIGYVSEPTRFYTKEGCNVYFEVRKDGESVDPMTLLM